MKVNGRQRRRPTKTSGSKHTAFKLKSICRNLNLASKIQTFLLFQFAAWKIHYFTIAAPPLGKHTPERWGMRGARWGQHKVAFGRRTNKELTLCYGKGKRSSEMEKGHSVSIPDCFDSLDEVISKTPPLGIVIQSTENGSRTMDATKKSQPSTITQMYCASINKCIYFCNQLNHSSNVQFCFLTEVLIFKTYLQ